MWYGLKWEIIIVIIMNILRLGLGFSVCLIFFVLVFFWVFLLVRLFVCFCGIFCFCFNLDYSPVPNMGYLKICWCVLQPNIWQKYTFFEWRMFYLYDKKQCVRSSFIPKVITKGKLFMIHINNKEYFSKEHFSRKKYTMQYSSACDNAITPY